MKKQFTETHDFELGKNHVPFIRVPKGGSSCATCKFLSQDKKNCTNKYFIEWHGKSELPQPIDSFCSDWYEPGVKLEEGGVLNKKVTFKQLFEK